MEKEPIKVAGLVRGSSWIFGVWGAIVLPKGIWDAFWGEPEANLYAPIRWAFVTQDQWLRYAGFEIAYGLACLGMAYLLRRYAWRLPEVVWRLKITKDYPF